MTLRFGTAPPVDRVETTRLVLRPYDASDLAAARRAEDRSRAHLARYMPWANGAPDDDAAFAQKLRGFRAAFDRGEDFVFGAFDRATGASVGGAGLHPRVGVGGLEIGYWVDVEHVRRGIATEMAAALTRVALEVAGCRWVEIRTATSNLASASVPRKLGFRHDATLRKRAVLPGDVVEDTLVFSLFADELAGSPAAAIPTRASRADLGYVLGDAETFASI